MNCIHILRRYKIFSRIETLCDLEDGLKFQFYSELKTNKNNAIYIFNDKQIKLRTFWTFSVYITFSNLFAVISDFPQQERVFRKFKPCIEFEFFSYKFFFGISQRQILQMVCFFSAQAGVFMRPIIMVSNKFQDIWKTWE